MTTKTEQIAEIEKRLAQLKAEVAQEEKAKSGNPHVFVPGKKESFNIVHQLSDDGKFTATSDFTHKNGKVKHAFRNEESAAAWAEAMNVMSELRAQPGACAVSGGGDRFVSIYVAGGLVRIDWWFGNSENSFTFSGAFRDAKSAEAARKAVGNERILKAARTLAGVV